MQDGWFQKRLSQSLQFKLPVSISLCILVSAVVAGIASFIFSFVEANELQDDMLREIAAQFGQLSPPTHGGTGTSRGLTQHDEDKPQIIVQYLNGQSLDEQAPADHRTSLLLLATLPNGFSTRKIEGDAYRIFVKKTANGQRIAVAQETEIRDDIAHGSDYPLAHFGTFALVGGGQHGAQIISPRCLLVGRN